MKRILTGLLASAMLLLGACSDDESGPKEQFSFDGETINLKNAKIYLTYEGNVWTGNHIYRDYLISDGTYTNADGNDGWSIDDYEGATYFLAIELAVPVEEDFKKGEYPTADNWDVADDVNISYIYLETGEDENYVEYYNENENGNSPVVASGGFDDGEKLTLKFSGKLQFLHKNPEGEDWIEEAVTGKFYVQGKVSDERETGAPTRAAQKHHGKGH